MKNTDEPDIIHLYNFSLIDNFSKKDTKINIFRMLDSIETSPQISGTIEDLSIISTNGLSWSVGAVEVLDHDNIDWTRIMTDNYLYKVIEGKLYKLGYYKKKDRKFILDEDGNKIVKLYPGGKKLVHNYRKLDKNITQTQKLVFDIDAHLSISETIRICEENNFPIALLYPSFSHMIPNEEGIKKEKFRVVFQIPFLIKDPLTYKTFIQVVGDYIFNGQHDHAPTSISNLIHGTFHDALICDKKAVISQDLIESIFQRNKNLKYDITDGVLKIHNSFSKKSPNKSSYIKKVYSIESLEETITNVDAIREHYKQYKGFNDEFDLFLDSKMVGEGTHNTILAIGFAWNLLGLPLNHWVELAFINRLGTYTKGDWAYQINKLIEEPNREGFYQSDTILRDLGFLDYTEENHKFIEETFWKNRVLKHQNYKKIVIEGRYLGDISKYIPEPEEVIEKPKKIKRSKFRTNGKFDIKKLKKRKKKEYEKVTLEVNESRLQKKILIIADTGVGKTTSVHVNYGHLSCFLLFPNTANVIQLDENKTKNPNIRSFYEGCKDVFKKDAKTFNVGTWNQAYMLKQGNYTYGFVDEIHANILGASYRGKYLESLKELEKRCQILVHFTATPDYLDFDEYDEIIEFEVTEKLHIPIELEIVSMKKFDEFAKKSREKEDGKIRMYMVQNKKKVVNFANANNIEYTTSDNKFESGLFKDITNDNRVTSDGSHTGVYNQGVSIDNVAHFELFLDNIRDYIVVKQYIARYRKALSIKVFLNIKPDNEVEMSKEYRSFQFIRNDVEAKANTLARRYNGFSEEDKDKYIMEGVSIKEAMSFKKGDWVVSGVQVDAITYVLFLSQFKQLGYYWSLQNYFDNITINNTIGDDGKSTIEDIYEDNKVYNSVTKIVNMKRLFNKEEKKETPKAYELEQLGFSKLFIGELLIISDNKKLKKIIRWSKLKTEKMEKGVIHSVPEELMAGFYQVYKKCVKRSVIFTTEELLKEMLKIKLKYGFNRSAKSLLDEFKTAFKVSKIGTEDRKPLYAIHKWTKKAIIKEIENLELFKMIKFENDPKREFTFNPKHYEDMKKII